MSTLIQTHFTNFFNDHKIIIIKGVDPIMDGDYGWLVFLSIMERVMMTDLPQRRLISLLAVFFTVHFFFLSHSSYPLGEIFVSLLAVAVYLLATTSFLYACFRCVRSENHVLEV